MPRFRISLRTRLALVFFAITFVTIGVIYLYVVPGLQTRLINERLGELSATAQRYSGSVAQTVGGTQPAPSVRNLVRMAGARSGDRVSLFSVATAVAPGGPQLTPEADSSVLAPPPTLAYRAATTGRLITGTATSSSGEIARAAAPLSYQGKVAGVIVYSAPVADIVHNVAIVRHEILVAGGIALVLVVIGGYLLSRALGRRVKRLERAAEQIAAGDFEHPIPVDSGDELGQLANAFNAMQHQLAQLESARKKFIATASHELRTPVFSLGGFVELLEDEELDPETRRRFLDQVRDQVERLRKLSVDLLDLSRLESGSLELREEEVDLSELTRAVSGEFEPTLAQHDSHLELRFAARTIEASCDPVRVAQIVRILIDNALTHTPPGTRIVVTAGRDDGHVRLAVRDNGEGIDGQAMRRIFEPFFTADDAQGSGLGLAIASELAERMSGHLSVRSAPGETIFTLDLPS